MYANCACACVWFLACQHLLVAMYAHTHVHVYFTLPYRRLDVFLQYTNSVHYWMVTVRYDRILDKFV